MRHEAQLSTLPQVIHRHWLVLIHETSISEYAFAASVREHYETNFPEHARTVEFSTQSDTVIRMKRDAEKLSRWFSDDVNARLPSELIESVIQSFPPDRRWKLQIELSARQRLLAVPMPKKVPGADGENLGRVGMKAGEAIIAISKILDDNVIDERDHDFAPEALSKIQESVSVLMEMYHRIVEQALKGDLKNVS